MYFCNPIQFSQKPNSQPNKATKRRKVKAKQHTKAKGKKKTAKTSQLQNSTCSKCEYVILLIYGKN